MYACLFARRCKECFHQLSKIDQIKLIPMLRSFENLNQSRLVRLLASTFWRVDRFSKRHGFYFPLSLSKSSTRHVVRCRRRMSQLPASIARYLEVITHESPWLWLQFWEPTSQHQVRQWWFRHREASSACYQDIPTAQVSEFQSWDSTSEMRRHLFQPLCLRLNEDLCH